MRILEINKFHYVKGGADKHFLDVTKLLREKGHEVAVFSMDHPKNELSPWKKYFVSRVGYAREDTLWHHVKGTGRMFYSWEARRKVRKLLNDFQPEVAHVHNIYHQISPSILKEIKKRGIPVVMTLHDYESISPDREEYFQNIGNRYWKFLFYKKYGFVQRSILVAKSYWNMIMGYHALVDFYISPSEFVRKVFLSAGIPARKIKVMGHFLSEEDTYPSSTENGPDRYAFYYGRIVENKGIRDLVDIFKSQKSMKLYLAGEQEGNFEVESHENIRYIGYLDKHEMKRYIMGSECVVSASKLPETFGLIALEAIERGRPFIALEAGAFREVITQGKSGYICQDKKELAEIIHKIGNKELSFDSEMIRQEAKKRYNRDTYAKELLNIFSTLL